jgi:hypothetical protein
MREQRLRVAARLLARKAGSRMRDQGADIAQG